MKELLKQMVYLTEGRNLIWYMCRENIRDNVWCTYFTANKDNFTFTLKDNALTVCDDITKEKITTIVFE